MFRGSIDVLVIDGSEDRASLTGQASQKLDIRLANRRPVRTSHENLGELRPQRCAGWWRVRRPCDIGAGDRVDQGDRDVQNVKDVTVKVHLTSLASDLYRRHVTIKRDDASNASSVAASPGLLGANSFPRPVRLLLLVRFVNRLGAFSLAYLAAVLVAHNHVTLAQAGVITAMFGLGTVVSRLLGGHVAAHWGSRNTIIIGLLGTAVGQFMIIATDDLPVTIVGVVVLGISFEVYEPASQAMIANETPSDRHPAVFGLLNLAIAVAGIASGLLATTMGLIDLRWLFVVDAATCIGGAIIALLGLPSTSGRTQRSRLLSGWRSAWTDRKLIILLILGSAFATIYLELTTGTPLSLTAIGIAPGWSGAATVISGLCMLAAQPLLNRTGGSPAHRMIIGCLVFAGGLAILAPANSLWPYLVSAGVCAVGELLLFSYGYTLIAAIAPANMTAQYYAIYGLSWGIALTVGPPIGNLLLQHGGPSLLWTAAAVAMVTIGIAQALLTRYITPAGEHGIGRVSRTRRP